MPKIRKPTKADISAMLSDEVLLKKYRNQTLISKPILPRKSKSIKKKEANNRFAKASHWAKVILTAPGMKALYTKGINNKLSNAQMVAVTDFLTAPVIHYISLKQHTGTIGDKIRIKATDDFQVTSVDVTIRDKKGKELEKGSAVHYKRKPMMWIYTLTVTNGNSTGTVIEVTAKDRPGNTVVKTKTIGYNS